ncbi:MAG: ligand-binding sensor domain-containing protein, partial [Glaciecola sp.]
SSGPYIGNNFNRIIQSSDGKIWLGGTKGLVLAEDHKTTLYSRKNNMIGNNVLDFLEDLKGNLWIVTNKGLCKFNGKTFFNYTSHDGFPFDHITCIEEDREGNLWIGTSDQGVVQFNKKSKKFKVFNASNGLSDDVVLSILEDFSNNIWVGTQGGGINKFSGETFTYYGDREGLTNVKSNSLFYDSKDNLWIATRKGVIKYEGDSIMEFSVKEGLPSDDCKVIFEDKQGNIWIGTAVGVAKLVDDEVKEIFDYKNGIMSTTTCIMQDSKGNMWFGTDGGGIVKYDGKHFSSYSMINGISSNRVTSIIEDDENTLWIGTFGGGVNRFNGFEFLSLSKEDGISSNIIYCLEKDPRGAIYMGTQNGITRYDKGEIVVIDVEDGLSSNNIKMMKFDAENSLWVSSERGLDRLYMNPPQVYRQVGESISEIKHYGKEDGITKGEVSTVCEDNQGNLWFGARKGLIKFDINIDEYNTQKPQTYITDLQIDYKKVNWKKRGYQVVPWTNIPMNLELSHDTANVTFSFVGINHKAPYDVKYQWKLEGFDKSFTPFTYINTVTYPKLPPGKYTFQVIACNSDEECNDEASPAEFEFEVAPPFWQEIWFLSIIGVVIVVVIYLLVKMRERKMKRERFILERKVKVRTQEVVDKNQELELVNLEIISKNKEIEERNKDVNSSIRYALTIQQASFPPIADLKDVFSDSFIYHLPRDIVSGDFYWYKKLQKEFVVAIVDCTGHGVPGAFMSMIGMTLLNEIMSGQPEIDPGQALNRLDLGIRKAFENSENSSNDGMDVVLCTINTDTKTIKYSGAYRPLYIVRKGELIEYKATKYAIGSKEILEKDYVTHVIPYEKGDCVYMLSDGYPDQFGGPYNKKFKTKVMKNMFLNVHHHDMEKQKELIHQRYLDWKGDFEQVDDILICGIKL